MLKVCETCQSGKQARHPFPVQTTHVSSKLLEMIHLDVWTTKIESIGGCKYYMISLMTAQGRCGSTS